MDEKDLLETTVMMDSDFGNGRMQVPHSLLIVSGMSMGRQPNHHRNEIHTKGKRIRRRTEAAAMEAGDVHQGQELWHRDQEAEWERWKETIREVRHLATGILFLLLIRGMIVRCCHNGRTTRR